MSRAEVSSARRFLGVCQIFVCLRRVFWVSAYGVIYFISPVQELEDCKIVRVSYTENTRFRGFWRRSTQIMTWRENDRAKSPNNDNNDTLCHYFQGSVIFRVYCGQGCHVIGCHFRGKNMARFQCHFPKSSYLATLNLNHPKKHAPPYPSVHRKMRPSRENAIRPFRRCEKTNSCTGLME